MESETIRQFHFSNYSKISSNQTQAHKTERNTKLIKNIEQFCPRKFETFAWLEEKNPKVDGKQVTENKWGARNL